MGTPVDDALDFACYFVRSLQKLGSTLGKPCLQIPEYLDILHAEGVISDNYKYPENNTEIRTPYDTLLKKNLGHAAYELFRIIARDDEDVSWIDDGVSVISAHWKLMIRYSNTSPKVTMKCDSKHELWIQAAERLLSVYFGITDYLIKHRNMAETFRTISPSENEFLYKIFQERAGKKLEDIEPVDVEKHLDDPKLKEALEADY